MLKFLVVLLFLGSFLGCAALSKTGRIQREDSNSYQDSVALPGSEPAQANTAVVTSVQPVSVAPRHSEAPSKRLGTVFGKTDFRGLLKAAYVRLTIVNSDHPEKTIFFYVGNKDNQQLLPWGQVVAVEPGYFYFNLAPGKYEITSIAIPAGTNIAEEPISLSMEVANNKTFYLGTLEVEGVKEIARFGGVPLVRPGFEYTVAVHDEFDQARNEFEKLLPRQDVPVVKKIFIIK